MTRSIALLVKRIFDIVSSFIALVLFFPLMAGISLLIIFNDGTPIFFLQPRLGLHGKTFVIIKFRTMKNIFDEKGNLLSDEKRLTRIGKFLRKTTLDELPELFNILKGDMSAVGPRPLLVDYRDLYTPDQWRRHEMRPGMAGPVLASGRNTLSWDEKFQQDVRYVDNWSLGLDLKTLFQTILKVIKREGTSAEGYATMPKFEGTEIENND